MIGGLLDVIRDPVVFVNLDHAEVNFYITLIASNGSKRAALTVVFEHGAVIDCGEQVAVHHQKGIVQIWDEGNRSSRAEGLLFARIIDTSVELTSVTAVCHEQFGKITGCQCDVVKAFLLQLTNHNFKDRHFTDGHEWFGENSCVRGKACAFAAS